jgi:uncharacterized protein YdcH (DUF465 family)
MKKKVKSGPKLVQKDMISQLKAMDHEIKKLTKKTNMLEDKLKNYGDDAQLANVDLQNWLQKQQQTIQMMSNISKMIHDNLMAVIRKIGGG